jgi:hypothetical protein
MKDARISDGLVYVAGRTAGRMQALTKHFERLTGHCGLTAERPLRKTYFWIFPVAVLGSSVTNVNRWGTLKWARRERANFCNSASDTEVPSFATMNASGTSPQSS